VNRGLKGKDGHMTNIRKRLGDLNLSIPVAQQPLASYVLATVTGNLIFTAGQLPLVDGQMVATGKVGQEVDVEQAKKLAEVCALNCLAAVETIVPIERIFRIVRVVGYVNGTAGFTNQPAVINGASELFLNLWGDSGRHARSAVGVAELPLNAPVEIELTVEITA
jgi:enamine deaminase RidA (YjgF/YER057c/UK114 family)